jgi:hypothetical protein
MNRSSTLFPNSLTRRLQPTVALLLLTVQIAFETAAGIPGGVVYEGDKGSGKGKHVVLIAGDHEYRSEETLPALARILAKHHGFKCTTLFTVHPTTGFIDPAANNLPGATALRDADLMIIFLRFKDLPDEQMRHIDEYLGRGRPVIGLRTATHAFYLEHPRKKYAKYHFQWPGSDYRLGFGRQVLGETWAGHYGDNHRQSTRMIPVPANRAHPVMRGVTDVHVQAGGYWANPEPNSKVLLLTQPLNGMAPTSPADPAKPPTPGAWVRSYTQGGHTGRVFTTTQGASEDLLNPGFRRLLVNASFWALGLETAIRPDLAIGFVGPYRPATYRFNGHRRQVYPADLAGWESPIMDAAKPVQ